MPERGKRKDIIRVGDVVEVVVPKIVDRVGYPRRPEDYRPRPDSPRSGEIYKKVKELERLIRGNARDLWVQGPTLCENQLLDVVQYHMARTDGFGGPERSVHLKEDQKFLGKRATVVKRRQVQTGVYYPSSGTISAWDDSYEPAGLADQKSVVLFGLDIHAPIGQFLPIKKDWVDCWIPASNLKKIEASK